MDFTLNEEQQMLADTMARFVQNEYEFEARRKRLADGPSDALARQMAELGLFALNVPEAHGGVGAGAVETLIVMEWLGRGLVIEPYVASAVIAPRLLSTFGSEAQKDRLLGPIAEGRLRFALAALEPQARYDLDKVRTRAARRNGRWQLDGAKAVVPHGDSADWLIVTADTGGGVALMLVDTKAPGVAIDGYPTLDGQRAAEIRFEGATVDDSCVIGEPGQGLALADWATDQGLAGLAAEAVGAMAQLTELSCEHLSTRRQFGVPIGSFQALQHRAADMRIAVEQARALALMAAAHVESPDRTLRRRAASAAKAMTGRSG
ncbi:MAG TPA: acyl-CoA dehydrogenase, partial [Burkholderiaceae bacterium]|nr:acyl-CoA dehydrogenase [Burkholderiaceae bacterium]